MPKKRHENFAKLIQGLFSFGCQPPKITTAGQLKLMYPSSSWSNKFGFWKPNAHFGKSRPCLKENTFIARVYLEISATTTTNKTTFCVNVTSQERGKRTIITQYPIFNFVFVWN